MVINVHAGHNPDGKVACGTIGLIKESAENRNVKNEVIRLLKLAGHTVYDCTVDDGKSSSDILTRIVQKCNSHKVDLDISIHFNAGAKDEKGNGKTTGVETYCYKDAKASGCADVAKRICDSITKLGFRNRGVKYTTTLYVVKNTKAPAILIECCFVDDADDVKLYDYKSMAAAIVEGITGMKVTEPVVVAKADEAANSVGAETATGDPDAKYRVQVGFYGKLENAETMKKKLNAAGFDAVIVKA